MKLENRASENYNLGYIFFFSEPWSENLILNWARVR